MDADQLLQEWTGGEQNGMRPARVQAVREELMELTGEYIPRRIPEIDAMIVNHPQKRGVITRKLREAVDDDAESE